MLRTLVAMMLGPIGMILLEFYIEHSILINSFALLYGILLAISHINYKRILDRVLLRISERKNRKFGLDDADMWANSIKEVSFFPLISGGNSLLPKKTNVDMIILLSKKDKKWNHAILTMDNDHSDKNP